MRILFSSVLKPLKEVHFGTMTYWYSSFAFAMLGNKYVKQAPRSKCLKYNKPEARPGPTHT